MEGVEGKVPEGRDVRIHIIDSLHRTAETGHSIVKQYIPIKAPPQQIIMWQGVHQVNSDGWAEISLPGALPQ